MERGREAIKFVKLAVSSHKSPIVQQQAPLHLRDKGTGEVRQSQLLQISREPLSKSNTTHGLATKRAGQLAVIA
jgi:hypothetical protein